MRVTRFAAAVLVLGSVLGGFTATAHAGTPRIVHQHAAVAQATVALDSAAPGNNGNG